MKPDLFEAPDYYNLDDLLSEEHLLVRDAARQWVKRDISPIIEEYAQKAEFPKQIIGGLAEIGAFGPYIPEEYGGAGLDQISYGLIMQEIERGDSGVRSLPRCNLHWLCIQFLPMVQRNSEKNIYPNWPQESSWDVLVLLSPIMDLTHRVWNRNSRIWATTIS